MNQLKITSFPPLGYSCTEAINALCTNLTFSGEHVKKIMVTSCHANEGKSFVSMNIMRTMAHLGKSIALVDADMRKSIIQQKYGLHPVDNSSSASSDSRHHIYGLAHMLAGKCTMEDSIYSTDIPGAYIVPNGRDVTNPLPLLNSPHMGELLDYLASNTDYVIIDAPPVGAVIDAAQIAKYCDGILIVVNYNTVRRQELIDVKEQLEQTECPILGTVMNMVDYDNYIGKKYYYKSYYSKYGYYGSEKEK